VLNIGTLDEERAWRYLLKLAQLIQECHQLQSSIEKAQTLIITLDIRFVSFSLMIDWQYHVRLDSSPITDRLGMA
jgi:hypothetical protein